jgi:HK97 family phage prohead protease
VSGVDEANRSIGGLVVPWDTPARVNGADFPVRFARGSILVDEGARLLGFHDRAQPLGAPIEWRDTPRGLRARFKVARTRAGDEALSMAADGILDGLSIGAELVEVTEQAGEVHVTAALAREVSLVTLPAWASARVGAD